MIHCLLYYPAASCSEPSLWPQTPFQHQCKDPAKIIYGVLIGLCTAVIRSYSLFTEGMMFAILIANSFAPLIDRSVKNWQAKQKEKAAAVSVPVQGQKEAK